MYHMCTNVDIVVFVFVVVVFYCCLVLSFVVYVQFGNNLCTSIYFVADVN